MAEYIDRDAALGVIEEMQRALCPVGRFGRSFVYGRDRETFDSWQEVADKIEFDIPAAPVAPVVHGQWVNRSEPDPDNNVTTTCSCCLHTDTHAVGMEVPFCWFCGAKMDKGDK